MIVCRVVHAVLQVLSLFLSLSLSLSVEEGICLPLEVWQESWSIFKGLPKVGEVATNNYVFLSYDWSLISS